MSKMPDEITLPRHVMWEELCRLQQERDALKEALRNLMTKIAPELTGPVKNVNKSTWAEAWDEAEALLAERKP